MIITLILLFIIGYLCIALEHTLRIDKTAIALLLGMVMWIVYYRSFVRLTGKLYLCTLYYQYR